jgi:hypothetical protein
MAVYNAIKITFSQHLDVINVTKHLYLFAKSPVSKTNQGFFRDLGVIKPIFQPINGHRAMKANKV